MLYTEIKKEPGMAHMLHFFNNRSLSTKLLILLIPILLINQVVDSYVLRMTRDQIYEDTIGVADDNVTVICSTFRMDLSRMEEGMSSLAEESSVREYLEYFQTRKSGNTSTFREQASVEGEAGRRLFDFLLLNRMLSGCGIVCSSDWYLFRNPYSYTITTTAMNGIVDKLHEAEEPYFLYNQEEGQPLLFYVHPILFEGNVCYLIALLDPAYFGKVIGEYARIDTEYHILDSKGRAVYTDKDFDSVRIHRAYQLYENTQDVVEIDGILYIFHYVEPQGWLVVSESHNYFPEESLDHIANVSMSIRSAVTIISILVLIAIAVFFSRRVREINTTMESIENGNFDSVFESNYSDEISRLGQHLNRMVARLKAQTTEISQKKEQVRTAQLQVLQNQINPHFLYNSFDYVRMKTLDPVTGAESEASQAIREIAEMLRYNIKNQFTNVTIRQEFDQMNRYLGIQQKLLRNRLQIKMDVDESVMDFEIIKFLLQPLAENAVLHGIEPKIEPSELQIMIKRSDDRVLFTIRDTGVGINPATLASLKIRLADKSDMSEQQAIGLKNVNDRLILFYGQESAIELWSVLGEGTCVRFSVPVNTKQEGKTDDGYSSC